MTVVNSMWLLKKKKWSNCTNYRLEVIELWNYNDTVLLLKLFLIFASQCFTVSNRVFYEKQYGHHPSYSPDLATCNFSPFMKGHRLTL